MKEVAISMDSWHYKVVSTLCNDVPQDVCAYIRWFLFALIVAVLGTGLAAGIIFTTADMLAWFAFLLLNLTWIAPYGPAILAFMLYSIIGLFAVIWMSQDGKF